MAETEKLWGGRFKEPTDKIFFEFNRSFPFDKRLLEVDVRASIAYSRALLRASVLDEAEQRSIEEGLNTILKLASEDPVYLEDNTAEDIHSFVESRLVQLIGEPGRKLHTGRSRNDQVATDLRLWLRNEINCLLQKLANAGNALVDFSEECGDAIIPGYTHMQPAQPILFGHWCLAYVEMLARDIERLAQVRRRVNVLPLGSAALAGTSYNIDRQILAEELGFAALSHNSMDAVGDRDFCVDFAAAASLIMVHLSRLGEDIIIYCTNEFALLELADTVATGSSIMPQKKNPDALELIRGKAGRVFGDLVALLSMLKGLPLAYNKDMQEDKEALFDVADTVGAALEVMTIVLRNISLNRERGLACAAAGYTNATELADYLVRRGIPFRAAHEAVGQLVLQAVAEGVLLVELPLEAMQAVAPLIEEDVYDALSLESAIATKQQTGGTARERLTEAMVRARRLFSRSE